MKHRWHEYTGGLLDSESERVSCSRKYINICNSIIHAPVPRCPFLHSPFPKDRGSTETAAPSAYHCPIKTELSPQHQLSQRYFHTLHHAAPRRTPFRPRLNYSTVPAPPAPAPLKRPSWKPTTKNSSSPCRVWYSPLSPTSSIARLILSRRWQVILIDLLVHLPQSLVSILRQDNMTVRVRWPIKLMSSPPWRYPNVGSPACGAVKNKCGTKLAENETKRRIVARRIGKSMLAKAENGDLGERMLTWNIKRNRRGIVELLDTKIDD